MKVSLQKKHSYPSIGQKKLSGAAARLMLNFGVEISFEILQGFPLDIHRSGVAALHVMRLQVDLRMLSGAGRDIGGVCCEPSRATP